MRTHYEILGVSKTATQQEIEERAEELGERYLKGDPDVVDELTEHHEKVKAAYLTLSDPRNRAAYDLRLKGAKTTNVTLVIIVIIGVAYMFLGSSEPHQFGQPDALYMCQNAIKFVARDPDTADVPYVKPLGPTKQEYFFVWNASSRYARLRNGLGLEVPATAYCTVDVATKRIVKLSVDGKSFIPH